MKKEIDEIDFALLKAVVDQPGMRQKDCYKQFMKGGGSSYSYLETFLWKRLRELARESYLRRDKESTSAVLLYPKHKAKDLVKHNNIMPSAEADQ